MNEQSKAKERRKNNPMFAERWLVGCGIDVGCGADPVSAEDYHLIESVWCWDVADGDAQFLRGVRDDYLDFVHASHLLEHLRNAEVALVNWLRVLKPGGFIVCTVPDELLYEYGRWPSMFNPDHKLMFTTRYVPVNTRSINVLGLLNRLPVEVERLELLQDGWSENLWGQDQTKLGAECSIEFVVRKPKPGQYR